MDEDEPESVGETYALDDFALMAAERLARALRRQLPKLAPMELAQASVVLLALERLPLITPDATISITLTLRPSTGPKAEGIVARWVSLTIDEASITFDRGVHIHTPGVGGDSESTVDYEASTCGSDGDASCWEEELRALEAAGHFSFEGWEPDDALPWHEAPTQH